MAKLRKAFDSNQHDDMSNFDPIPADKYVVQITDSDYVQNSKKNGYFIKLVFTVMEGEYQGRKIWANLNVDNPSPQAVEIANKEFATICRACGKPQVDDTAILHGIPMTMGVRIKPAKGDFAAANASTGYEQLSSAASVPPTGGKTAKKKKKKKVEVDTSEAGDGWE